MALAASHRLPRFRLARSLASLLVLGVGCGTDTGSIEGVWETEEFRRKTGEVLEDIPATLPAERWEIARPPDCEDPCTLRLTTTALEGEPRPIEMDLRPEGAAYVADLEFVSQCIDPTSGQVLESNASEVDSTYNLRLAEGDEPRLEITFAWEATPTPEGLAAGCDIRSAEYETTARPA